MLRLIFIVLLPLVAPFAIYALVVWFLLRRRGGAAPGFVSLNWREAPLGWLMAVGLCGGIAGLAYLHFTTGYSPDTKLVPPAVVDGVVVPSHPVE